MPQPNARLCGQREADHKPCPVPDLALDLDPPLVQLHNAMNLGQPQPGAFFFRRKKRQKDLVEILFGNAFPVILECALDDVGSAATDLHPPHSGGDRQRPSGGHRIEGVGG